MALSPISTLLAGFLAEIIGIRSLFLYCAILGIIVTIIIWRFTSIRFNNKGDWSELEKIAEDDFDMLE